MQVVVKMHSLGGGVGVRLFERLNSDMVTLVHMFQGITHSAWKLDISTKKRLRGEFSTLLTTYYLLYHEEDMEVESSTFASLFRKLYVIRTV